MYPREGELGLPQLQSVREVEEVVNAIRVDAYRPIRRRGIGPEWSWARGLTGYGDRVAVDGLLDVGLDVLGSKGRGVEGFCRLRGNSGLGDVVDGGGGGRDEDRMRAHDGRRVWEGFRRWRSRCVRASSRGGLHVAIVRGGVNAVRV